MSSKDVNRQIDMGASIVQEQVPRSGLSPFFQAEFPAKGSSNGYWAKLTVKRMSKLENGWARISLDNADGKQKIYAVCRVKADAAFAVPDKPYTLVVEVDNCSPIEGKGKPWLCVVKGGASAPQLVASAKRVYKISGNGVYRCPLVIRQGDGNCLIHIHFAISPECAASFDVRLGLFEGDYQGEWLPCTEILPKKPARGSRLKRKKKATKKQKKSIESGAQSASSEKASEKTSENPATDSQAVPAQVEGQSFEHAEVAGGEQRSEDPIIEFNDVVKTYHLHKSERERLVTALGLSRNHSATTINAVNHLSFSINAGDAVALFGRNGAGKSTTLKMITGVSYPTSGSVEVRGQVSALLELTAGFDAGLTGRENIRLRGQIAGYSDDRIAQLEPGIIEFADLGEYIDQPLRTYSSGMRSRLGFAFAVSTNPEILIIDEVLAVGDKAFKAKCSKKVREIVSDENVTVLFVTHSSPLAKEFCKRGLVLDHGTLVFDGEINDAIKYYDSNY